MCTICMSKPAILTFHTHTWMHAHAHTRTHTHMNTHAHTRTHTHMNTHAHTRDSPPAITYKEVIYTRPGKGAVSKNHLFG